MDILQALSEIAKQPRTPEETAALVKELAAKLPSSVVQEARRAVLAQKAREDTAEGYASFYELVHGFAPPRHVMDMVKLIHRSHGEGVGTVVFAARGFWKSVSLSVTFVAWRVGLEPHKTNVIVSANDDSAEKVTKAIAAIIEFHPEWKRVFPNITPDTGRWSVEGFSVLDSAMSREEWAKSQSGVIDPTIVGGGYKSSRLIGKHPSGCLVIDDIHDRDNSSSERERKVVVDILVKTILKTVIKKNDRMDTWLIAVGTPWALDDAYYTMKNTGQYNFISIPAMAMAKEGDEGAVYIDGKNRDGVIFEDVVGWWKLNFPQYFGIKSVIKERADGKQSFWQMIMLDLATASTGRLRYYEYPKQDIEYTWPTVGGADPTTFERAMEGNYNSHFALAYLSKYPKGGAIVVGGVLEQCTMVQAENHILYAQNRFDNWLFCAVENVSVGKVFLQSLYRNANIRALPSGLKNITDGRISNKHDRIMSIHKYFEDGTVRISNEETPFLNALRRLFDRFYDLDEKDYAFDAGDAVYHAIQNMPDVLITQEYSLARKERGLSPIAGIGSYKGYG